MDYDSNTLGVNGYGLYVKNSGSSYTAGTGIDITNNEISVTLDNTTIEDNPSSGGVHIVDGVLPQYGTSQEETHAGYFSIVNPTDDSSSHPLAPNKFTDSTTMSSLYDMCNVRLSLTLNGREYISTGQLNEMVGTMYYSRTTDFYCEEYMDTISEFDINCSTSFDNWSVWLPSQSENGYTFDFTEITNGLIVYLQDEKKYVDLGSQLGTGWEQDREYTVKFKNGKLYLS